MSQALDDADVVARAIKRPDEFALLFDRHAPAIHRYASRRLGPDNADDLVMTTFTAAFDGRARFVAPENRSARPWLFGIASNLVKQHFKASRRSVELRVRLSGERSSTPSDTETVNEMLALAGALEGLPEQDRETLLLVSVGELTYEEAALALDIPIGTVRSRVNRARGRLRNLIESETGGPS